VRRLTVSRTIEQRILEMQSEKWDLADAVLGETSGLGGLQKSRKLTIGELCRLFGL
jgi:SNF2 family DNA or RNA helicase